MITSVNFRNFKAFQNAKLELRPLTILLGPNNSGKSSVLSSLRILVQTVESYDSRVVLLLNGMLGDFGTYKDIIHGNHRGRHLRLGVEVVNSSNVGGRRIPPDSKMKIDLGYRYRSGRREVILADTAMSMNGRHLISTKYSTESERQLVQRIGSKSVPSSLKSSVSRFTRFQNFIPQGLSPYMLRGDESVATQRFLDKSVESAMMTSSRVSLAIYHSLRQVEYVGAMRIQPSRTFLYTGESRIRVGAGGENAANILAMDDARGKSKSKGLSRLVSSWLSRSQMASSLQVKPISDRHYELRISHYDSGESQNFADTGFGHSQVLPVLVAGYNTRPGSTLIVEQPEIHLHPRAQAELGEFFTELYKNKVQSIVETHSEHLILRLQQKIASGELSEQDVAIYYVHSSDGKKAIHKMTLDERGQFVSEWPDGFFPERLNEAKNLSRIRYARRVESEKTTQ